MKNISFLLNLLFSIYQMSAHNFLLDKVVGKDTIENSSDICEPSYNYSEIIFEELSSESRMKFIDNNKCKLNPLVINYYDKYKEIKDENTIVELLKYCNIHPKDFRNKTLPIKIYILGEITENKNIDGYLGEWITDIYYTFFQCYPGYFYQYLSYLDTHLYQDKIKEILFHVIYGIYYESLNEKKIKEIFKHHGIHLPERISQINQIEKFIFENKDNI